MFRSSKFEVTEGDPIFEVRYLGCRETDRAFGTDCTTASVSALWLRCPYEKTLPKGYLQVGLGGVSLSLNGRIEQHDIQNVSYCCVESSVNDRIFAWIYRMPKDEQASIKSTEKLEESVGSLSISSQNDADDQSEHQRLFLREEEGAYSFMCHAVLASKPSRGQVMAATLRRAFHVAYKDWKRVRSKDERARMVKSLTERNLASLPRAAHSESDFEPNVTDAETRSLGALGGSLRAVPNGDSISLSQDDSGSAIRDDADSWSSSGNE